MHFRLPKPLHGWREFAGEVGIIVVGVLIALSAEQLVEAVNQGQLRAGTRAAVRKDIEINLASLQLRGQAEPCIGRRLAELRKLIDEWGATGQFTTPRWVAQAPVLGIDLSRYDAATAGGRVAMLPSEEQYRLGSLATSLHEFGVLEEGEGAAWGKLRELQTGPRALSESDRAVIRGALQDAALSDYNARTALREVLPRAAKWGFRPDLADFHEYARRVWKSGRFTPSICAAIDSDPARANAATGQVVPLAQ